MTLEELLEAGNNYKTSIEDYKQGVCVYRKFSFCNSKAKFKLYYCDDKNKSLLYCFCANCAKSYSNDMFFKELSEKELFTLMIHF